MWCSGPAGTALRLERLREVSFEEFAASRALNWGMGSSSLNAEVNAFDRLQNVRERNFYKAFAVEGDSVGGDSHCLESRPPE